MSIKEKARKGIYFLSAISFTMVVSAGYTWYTLSSSHDAVVQDLSARIADLDSQAEILARSNAALQARVHVYRAEGALGEANLGTASEYLEIADGALSAACNGLPDCPYSGVQSALDKVGTQVATGAGPFLVAIADISVQLDGVIEPPQ